MTYRPFFRASIEQLEALFGEAKDSESLAKLKNELKFRTTQRALNLLRSVEEASGARAPKTSTLDYSRAEKRGEKIESSHQSIPSQSANRQSAEQGESQREEPLPDATAPLVAPTSTIFHEDVKSATEKASTPGFESRKERGDKALSESHVKLLDLLTYLEHLAKLSEKPIYALREYQHLAFFEAELKGQIGITHDVPSDEGQIWLRIERLQRTDPPPPPEEIREWLTISRDLNQPPKIQDSLVRTVTAAEADELVSSGKARREDRSPSTKFRDGKPMADVVLRLTDQPSKKSAVMNYVSGKWSTWAESEKPRRATIAIYDRFFSLYQSLQAEGAERPVEIVWGIGIARWKLRGHEIDHPLIEQLIEIYVDTQSGLITVGPRSSVPQPALKPYFSLEIDGTDATLSFAKQFFETMPIDQEFSPFQRDTFEPVLRFAATHLDSSGKYYPDTLEDINDRLVPESTGSLVVTDTWAIYARPRSANFFIEDLDRLRAAVTDSADLPGPSRKLVETPSSEATYSPQLVDVTKATFGSLSPDFASISEAKATDENEREFFFPKPFNADQVAIVERLEQADGVVVQGPPGTGKTHTIANIICHSLATGRKVLVTSKGEAALGVLREHIPEGIRDLTISLLTNEREGLKQLERAVGILASAATQTNPSTLEKQILAGQQQIVDLKKRLVSVDTELARFAEKHLAKIPHKSSMDGLLPIELAQLIASEANQHCWLPDKLSLDPKYEPLFDETDIASLRQARHLLGKDICYTTEKSPALPDLPGGEQILALHEDIVNCEALERKFQDAHFARLSMSTPDALDRCRVLADSIKQVVALFETVGELVWLKPLVARWREKASETERDALFEGILTALGEIRKKRTEILAYALVCPESTVEDKDVVEAIHRASRGERPFGIIPLGKSLARERFALIKIEGRTPSSTEHWYKVERYIAWSAKLSSAIARWNAAATEYGLPPLSDRGEATARWLSDVLDKIDKAKAAVRHCAHIEREILDLFPVGVDPNLVVTSLDYALKAIRSIEANLALSRYQVSRTALNTHIQRLSKFSGPIVEKLRDFLTQSVGNPQMSARMLSDAWQDLCREVDRIQNLKTHLEGVNRVARLIRDSGAPKWADFALREEPGLEDKWTPAFWSESWSWARFRSYLQEIDGRERFRQLSSLRRKHESEIQQAFAEVVRLRTYLGLRRNITNQVEAALNMFMAALRQIGKGTGIRARRFRKDARNAMEKSYAAVPCWIMPTWRISESLPASLGSFDVVIIDEASQSDITALPALLRGKKVLIVGDDKQVSPTAAFVEERKLLQLRHNYLQDQPFGPLMLPGFSLYELALATFPGKRIMLREHFRCVEPIIRFSFQFYEEPIVPVRIAKPSERLTPPLVDVYVPHGRKDKRQINIAEGDAIVDEIEKLVRDPAFAKRSIGVVSLLAAKQAYYIQSHLLERIGEEEYLKHQITCGDSATFQGKERDIMFVSMVECPETRSTKTALLFQQRFNVALSRARDRMYLFHSVTEKMLKPDDLKARVLQHFKRPMPTASDVPKDVLEQCDSDFERVVLKRLLDLGYRVTPQVKVGPFSIDMVVEGEADRRLAIELDGDKYHTPDRWADDLARQRVMERVGWRFWRCWGSSYVLDPEACFSDLLGTLNLLEIRPAASDSNISAYTEFRVHEDTSKSEPGSDSPLKDEAQIAVGDRVLVMFNDEPGRQHTIVLSRDQTDEVMGIYSVDHIFGKSLLNAMIDDQISIPMGDKVRIATILGIKKAQDA
jgi:very-short-patch-repair endonuclease